LETDYETHYISVFYEPVAANTDTERWTIKYWCFISVVTLYTHNVTI